MIECRSNISAWHFARGAGGASTHGKKCSDDILEHGRHCAAGKAASKRIRRAFPFGQQLALFGVRVRHHMSDSEISWIRSYVSLVDVCCCGLLVPLVLQFCSSWGGIRLLLKSSAFGLFGRLSSGPCLSVYSDPT